MSAEATGPVVDAWEQMHDLLARSTKDYEVRRDLNVTAHGCDRSVEVSIAYPLTGQRFETRQWHSAGKRNVGTMRELAQALLAACDFVEQMNPTWAVHVRREDTP